MDITRTIKELEERLQAYISEISIKMLEYTPFIVEVGALTVGTDENGFVITQNKNFPMQFSKISVNEIMSLTFRDGNGNIIKPKVYSRYEWYSEKIEIINFTLEELKKLAA